MGVQPVAPDNVYDSLPHRKRAIDLAHGVPICGFTGINGAGKTLLAVSSAIADMQRGRTVYSTVPIRSPWGNSEPILSLRQLLHIENATILLDEVAVIFSSSSTTTLPAEVVILLQTLRHKNTTVRWTAPAWMRCNNQLRDVTQGLVNVIPLARKFDGSPWPTPRIVMAGLLDTTTGKTDETPTKVLRRRMALPRRTAGWGTYDSMADTPMLGHRKVGGRCIDCYGSQETPKHSKQRHQLLNIPWYGDDELATYGRPHSTGLQPSGSGTASELEAATADDDWLPPWATQRPQPD